MLINVEQIAISKTSRRNVFSTLKQHNQRETAFLPKQQNIVCSSCMSHMLNKYQLVKTFVPNNKLFLRKYVPPRVSQLFSSLPLRMKTLNKQRSLLPETKIWRNAKKLWPTTAASTKFHWESYELNITTLS